MDPKVAAVLAEYEAREAVEAEEIRKGGADIVSRINEFLIPIGRDVGQLLNLLIKTHGCKTLLEVGASYGNSTVWLAEAAKANGGKVISLELAQYKVDHAKGMLRKAGLDDVVEFRVGDALASLETLSGPFDFVLIDLWKDLYIPVLDAVYPKLAEGALVAADNMIYPPVSQPEAKAYRRHVRAQPNIESVLLHIGQGVELSRYATNA